MSGQSSKNGSIVIVDDNPDNLRVLSGVLEGAGFVVRPAISGEIALSSIRRNPPDLVLLDIRMPGMDGYETCRQLKDDPLTRDIPVIFISALQETGDKVAAFSAGGVDYVTKPFQFEEVLARVRVHLELHHIKLHLDDIVTAKTEALRETMASLLASQQKYRDLLEQIIDSFGLAVEYRDPYTAGHQRRVAELAGAIATEMGMQSDALEGLRLGALVHDLGKIRVPSEILNRPGKLGELEMGLIRTHSQTGTDILHGVNFSRPVAQMVMQHHERIDGSGYPKGLKGDEILLEARIIAVSDVVEAMVSHRPYRAALGVEKALEEIREGSGRLYDPEVVGVCLELFEQRDFKFSELAF
ncbi:MAG TPA: HD domain-containing phosphohydrolase [Gallionella sp.]|nr:HD domain-containing phosphohydrolase [Gallionella sp.]